MENYDVIRQQIQVAVGFFEDTQRVRLAQGSRLCAAIKTMLPEMFGKDMNVTDDMSDEEKEKIERKKMTLLQNITKEYRRITDYYAEKFNSTGRLSKVLNALDDLEYIRTSFTLELVKNYVSLLELENKSYKSLELIVKQHPMWDGFFADVKGVGPSIAGKIIAAIDIHEARHVSCVWSYFGLGTRTDENGERVCMSRQHLVTCTYIDKDGVERTRKTAGYSPRLQSIAISLLTGSIIKTGKGSIYWQCYYDYKNRYMQREDLQGSSNKRYHLMASRQCAKAVLRDLWCAWRTYEGYELSLPYEVEKLGRPPHKYNAAHAAMGVAVPVYPNMENSPLYE